jgi:hypothetical protein
MNWVKLGNTFSGANSSFNAATPPPIPRPAAPRPTGDISGGLSGSTGTSNIVRTPAAPTAPATPATPQTPARPINTVQPAGPGGLMGMLGSLGTPQGFATAGTMMPGLLQTVGNVGGMPALMGTYQYLKSLRGGEGANDWNTLTKGAGHNKQAANDPWMAVLRNRMPVLHEPWGAAEHAAEGLHGLTQAVPRDDLQTGNPLATAGKHMAMDLARREAMFQGLNRTAKHWGPRLGAQEAKRIPGLKGAFYLDTPLNAIEDVGDLAGVMPYWAGGKGDTLWFKAQRDPMGNLMYDANGDLKGETRWNPNALGNWDMKQFDTDTTPNDRWGFNLLHTGTRADAPLSYLGSSLNAYNHPLKSSYSLGKFMTYDMNPIRDWDALSRPELLRSPSYHPNSIPGTWAQTNALQPGMPAPQMLPGGPRYAAERAALKRQHLFHPIYNPDEPGGWEQYQRQQLGFK